MADDSVVSASNAEKETASKKEVLANKLTACSDSIGQSNTDENKLKPSTKETSTGEGKSLLILPALSESTLNTYIHRIDDAFDNYLPMSESHSALSSLKAKTVPIEREPLKTESSLSLPKFSTRFSYDDLSETQGHKRDSAIDNENSDKKRLGAHRAEQTDAESYRKRANQQATNGFTGPEHDSAAEQQIGVSLLHSDSFVDELVFSKQRKVDPRYEWGEANRGGFQKAEHSKLFVNGQDKRKGDLFDRNTFFESERNRCSAVPGSQYDERDPTSDPYASPRGHSDRARGDQRRNGKRVGYHFNKHGQLQDQRHFCGYRARSTHCDGSTFALSAPSPLAASPPFNFSSPCSADKLELPLFSDREDDVLSHARQTLQDQIVGSKPKGRPPVGAGERRGQTYPSSCLMPLDDGTVSRRGHQKNASPIGMQYRTSRSTLSPQLLPRIQNSQPSNHCSPKEFFERSSCIGSSVDLAPSMLLFNHSFDDSFGDSNKFLDGFPQLDESSRSFGGSNVGTVDTPSNSAGPSPRISDPAEKRIAHNVLTSDYNQGRRQLSSSNRLMTMSERCSGDALSLSESPPSSVVMLGMTPSTDSLSPGDNTGSLFSIEGTTERTHSSATLKLSEGSSQHVSYSKNDEHKNKSGDRAPKGDCTRGRHQSIGLFRGNNRRHLTATVVSPPEQMLPQQEPPNFYLVLRRYRKVFEPFTFLLPGLKVSSKEFQATTMNSIDNMTAVSNIQPTKSSASNDDQKAAFMPEPTQTPVRSKKYQELSPSETILARRRVFSAVCAFGGTIGQKGKSVRNNNNISTIFRTKNALGTNAVYSFKTSQQVKYEQQLPTRYYENDNRLSWEIEEQPPVEIVTDDEDNVSTSSYSSTRDKRLGRHFLDNAMGIDYIPNSARMSHRAMSGLELGMKRPYDAGSPSPTFSAMGMFSCLGEPPKMRYRCKLCGQPKQNHYCPYEQSLQRSIGTMSYPAVNAYTSSEPGKLAPSLAEMNNFSVSENEQQSNQSTVARANPDEILASSDSKCLKPHHSALKSAQVPSSQHLSHNDSPSSSLSTESGVTMRQTPPKRTGDEQGPMDSTSIGSTDRKRRRTAVYSTLKAPAADDISNDLLFVDAMEIKPEQLRTLTAFKGMSCSESYMYPALPLTYGQRKRMSDSLFTLSKEVSGLTDECADVLRDARETDLWDLAVAELMTQVVTAIHCSEGDNKMDGLRKYLLTLGIAC